MRAYQEYLSKQTPQYLEGAIETNNIGIQIHNEEIAKKQHVITQLQNEVDTIKEAVDKLDKNNIQIIAEQSNRSHKKEGKYESL